MFKKLLITFCLVLLSTIAAAEDFKVSAVEIEGNLRIETSTILAATPIRPGDQVSMEDIDAAMANLFSLGRFEDISARLTEVQGAKVLTFVVSELPLVRTIRFDGRDEITEETLRSRVVQPVPAMYSQAKVRESIVALKNAYAEDGYHAANIKAELETDERNEAVLVFNIVEGDKVLIDEIRFSGNTVIEADDLKDVMENRERWWLSWLTDRGAYNPDALELDVERIKAAYKDKGYMDIKVRQPKVSLIDKDRYFLIEIEVDEGDQYKVGTLGVKGDLLKSEEELLENISLGNGDVFNRSELHRSIELLTDIYAEEGYANVNVAPLSNKDKQSLTIDLMFDIEQGEKIYIERVNVRGNTRTRDKVVRREVPIVEGETYSASKIKEANRRVRNLGYFDEVNVTKAPGSAENQAVLNVDVKEKPTGTFSIGAGYSSVDSFIAQGSITQDNFLGLGLKLRLSAALSGSSNTFSLGVTDPYFLDTEWTVGGEVYKTEREYDDYDENRTGGALKAGHRIAEYTKGYLTYRFEQSEILNIDESVTSAIVLDAEGTSTHSSLTGEIVRNSTDYHLDPSTGGISSISLQYAGIGGTENFLKTILEHRHFWPLFWGTVFSLHGETGSVFETQSDGLPLGEKFFLGGIRNMRGFETREVGPQDEGTYIGGETMAYFNFEFIFPISKSMGLKGLLFYDIGNAWLKHEDYGSDWRHSAGAGIRWNSPLGPLRFEWGYNLDPRDDEDQSVFEFTIGKPF
ncbi:Beta-barrel assembly machine subunit BamA [Malonomonas rubra DSM 5091]|uniref:Outer membrane protein assembly factor BamA n=1 Tax=Malonomonas rubra DSM 5091 TaxID=1122189 RepID=A0A1M6C9S0_MALRU|nr:outer membrane protein assembly factor BamA [Malonomonas rubra]SHI57531.1 Beta-barrel assembly machine subunit BamA [Malonomonas rubra DSM 5091]